MTAALEELERLEKASELLMARLEKVVQPAVDASVVPMDGTPERDIPVSPFASRLQSDRRVIDRITRRIEDTIGRLEL